MRVLLDECIPKQLKRDFGGHFALTVGEAGWAGVKNGELLRKADASFDVFVTLDSSLPFQQNLSSMKIRIVLMRSRSNEVEDLRPLMPKLLDVLVELLPGTVTRIE